MGEDLKNEIWAVPDIHGRFDLLKLLLLKFNPDDFANFTLVFLGDMIDRGPESAQVVGEVRRLCTEMPNNVFALRGNHETFMVDFVTKKANGTYSYDEEYLWGLNGGGPTVRSYREAGRDMADDVKWIRNLPLAMEQDGFFFSHAPAPREKNRAIGLKGKPFTLEELTWTYSPDEFGVARKHDNGVIGVCGHVHALQKGIKEPRFYPHYIFADAGCGCHPTAPLVAIEVRSRKVLYAKPEELPEL